MSKRLLNTYSVHRYCNAENKAYEQYLTTDTILPKPHRMEQRIKNLEKIEWYTLQRNDETPSDYSAIAGVIPTILTYRLPYITAAITLIRHRTVYSLPTWFVHVST